MSGADAGTSDWPTRLSVTSETANMAAIRGEVEGAARRLGFEEPEVTALCLAIDEAVANVIRHGYQGQQGQPIELVFEPVERDDRTGLQVTISDLGRQVDPATIVGRELHDVRPGGLGTHIMRTVMDEVEYRHRDPAGMELRMLKFRGTGVGDGAGLEGPADGT